MTHISRTNNLKLSNRFSCKLVAISIIALLSTYEHASSRDDEIDLLQPNAIASLPVALEDASLVSETGSIVRRSSIFSEAATSLTLDESQIVRILCLDGGGACGIAMARFVQKLTEQTGKSVPEMFHLIAGTSAGGMLAAAYTLPAEAGDPKKSPPKYSSDFIFHMMMEKTKTIFQKSWSLWGLLGPRYKSEPVEKFTTQYFGDATFDKTTTDVLITTFDITAGKPKIIKSWDDRETFYTRNVLESTSAAPTYFAPRHIFPVAATATPHLGYVLSDGGTCANNPTACALASARKLYPTATQYEIVSLGTGNATRPLHYTKMRNAGLLGWGRHLIDIFMSGQSAHTDYLMETLFRPEEYSRWNPVLAAENAALDNSSDNNLRDLVQAEDELIASRRGEFERLAARLSKPKADLVPIYSTARRA